MRRRSLLAALALVAIVGGTSWLYFRFRSQQTPPARETITVGTFSKAYGNLPFYVARHLRWFENDTALRNADVRYVEFNDRPAINDALSKGSLQVLFSGDAPALLTRAQGAQIRALAVSGSAQQELVVPPGSRVQRFQDLKGKRVAVLQATSSHYALLKLLSASGLKEKDVRLIFLSPPEARTAFESGQVDAWAVWAPFIEQEQANGKGRVLAGSDALINSLMSVSDDFIAVHPAEAKAIVAIIQKAKTWMVLHPDSTRAIAADQLSLAPTVVALAWPKFNWQIQLSEDLASDLQEKIDFLASLDKTRQSKTFDVRREYLGYRASKAIP